MRKRRRDFASGPTAAIGSDSQHSIVACWDDLIGFGCESLNIVCDRPKDIGSNLVEAAVDASVGHPGSLNTVRIGEQLLKTRSVSFAECRVNMLHGLNTVRH